METPTRNPNFYKRKFWFPVGVFSLVLLPLLLYSNLQYKLQSNEELFSLEIELSDAQREFGDSIIRAGGIEINNEHKNVTESQINHLNSILKIRRKENPYDDFSNVFLEIKLPVGFSYQNFISLTDSLNKFRPFDFTYGFKGESILLFRSPGYCGNMFMHKSHEQMKPTKINLKFKHYLILAICFSTLVFFNLRNLIRLRKNRKHFSA